MNMFRVLIRLAVLVLLSFPAMAKDVFVVAVPVQGPWNYFQEDGEQLAGIDIDVVRAVARESNYKFEFKPMGAGRAMKELKAGNIDAIAGVSTNFASVNGLLVAGPYIGDIHQEIFQRADTDKPVMRYKDLYSHVTGIVRTFSYFDELDDDPLITREYSEDPDLLFGKLKNGELDVVAASQWEVAYYLKSQKLESHTFVPAPADLSKHRAVTDRAMAFRKDVDQGFYKKIRRTMLVLEEDGILSSIIGSYRGKFLAPGAPQDSSEQ